LPRAGGSLELINHSVLELNVLIAKLLNENELDKAIGLTAKALYTMADL
jgi:hypothetical protein